MFIINKDGDRIEVGAGYILQSGESLALSPLFMDHATREQRRSVGLTDADVLVCDAYGAPGGFARGFAFVADSATRERAVDAIAAAQDAAAIAYEARNRYLQNAWKHRGGQDHDQHDGRDDRKPAPPRSLQDAQAAAERAYQDRNEWLRTAWRAGRDAA